MARPRTPVLLLLLVLLAAACSKIDPEFVSNEQVAAEDRTEEAAPAAPQGGGGGALEFIAVDIAFEAAPTTAPPGEVTFALNNQGATEHNISIDSLDGVLVEANGGETAEETVTLEPGTYEYYCSVPGHSTLMRGQLTVQ